MARNTDTLDVDVDTSSEVESVDAPAEEKAPKAPTRPPVPEGYITPVGFAKVLSKQLGKEIPPQQVYSTIKNAPKDHPFPVHEAGGRQNLIVESEGLQWWAEKDARTAERKQNAAAKKAEKEARAAAKASEPTEPAPEVAEAE